MKQKRLKDLIGFKNFKFAKEPNPENEVPLKSFQWMKKLKNRKIQPLSDHR